MSICASRQRGLGLFSLAMLIVILAFPIRAEEAETPAGEAADDPISQAVPFNEGEWREPPSGKWFTDDYGGEYFIRSIPKLNLWYRQMAPNVIRLRGGPWLEVAKETDDAFFVYVYKAGTRRNAERPQSSSSLPPRTPEEIAEIEAGYEVDIKSADVLELVPFDAGLPQAGMWRNGFDVADINGDGHLDIIHGPPRKTGPRPWVFLGNSEGGWVVWDELEVPEAPYDYGDVAVADFDNDGKLDMVFGMHLRGVLALRNLGEGRFEKWTEGIEFEWPDHKGVPAFTTRSLTTVDWDGDGDQDILAFAEGPRGFEHVDLPGAYGKVLYLNQGNGTWRKVIDVTEKVFGDAIVLGDFDGDDKPDFVTSTSVQGRRELVNMHAEDGGWDAVHVDMVRGGSAVWGAATGDFDGDGRDDIALSYSNRQLSERRSGIDILYSRPEGVWERRPVLSTTGEERVLVHGMATGDLDADGALDLVVGTRDGRLLVYRGDGEGFLVAEESPETDPVFEACRGYGVRLIDLDGDKRDEIVANFASEECAGGRGGALKVWQAQPKS
ncbi:MAG: VCBS repeat-containing protein [Acidobacteriota bacterium]